MRVADFEETDKRVSPTKNQLEAQLEKVDEQLRRGLRARGFNPDQYDNLALTAPLARLYTERENLKAALVALSDDDGDGDGDGGGDGSSSESDGVD